MHVFTPPRLPRRLVVSCLALAALATSAPVGGPLRAQVNEAAAQADRLQYLDIFEMEVTNDPRVSPDGSSLLVWHASWDDPSSIWIHDLRRGSSRRELGGEPYTWFAWGPEPGQITGGRCLGAAKTSATLGT